MTAQRRNMSALAAFRHRPGTAGCPSRPPPFQRHRWHRVSRSSILPRRRRRQHPLPAGSAEPARPTRLALPAPIRRNFDDPLSPARHGHRGGVAAAFCGGANHGARHAHANASAQTRPETRSKARPSDKASAPAACHHSAESPLAAHSFTCSDGNGHAGDVARDGIARDSTCNPRRSWPDGPHDHADARSNGQGSGPGNTDRA